MRSLFQTLGPTYNKLYISHALILHCLKLLLISLKDLETKLYRHNQRGCISALHKSLHKGGVKKRFCLCRIWRHEFNLPNTFKAIDSPERLSFKIHPRYFTFTCLNSIPLYTIFKDLAFWSLCLEPNKADFVLSCSKCILNLLSPN